MRILEYIFCKLLKKNAVENWPNLRHMDIETITVPRKPPSFGSLPTLGPFAPQGSSVTQSCPTLCDSMDRSTPGFPVHHQLLELAQTHVHGAGDAIQPSHLLSSPSLAFNISQHQSLFQWVSSSIQEATVMELQLQHQSFQWIFRTDLL